jgi:hypothetical protein
MSDAERNLLLTLARAVQRDPSMCERVWETLPLREQDARRGYGGSAADYGQSYLGELMDAVDQSVGGEHLGNPESSPYQGKKTL